MAVTRIGQRARLIAKVKYEENGVIKNATRSLGPGGAIGYGSGAAALDNQTQVEQAINALQGIITDTIVGFQIEMVDEFTGNFGTPGTNASQWDAYEDVKLINNFTDGDKNVKETVKRVATAAESDNYAGYAIKIARLQVPDGESDPKYTAVDGYLTGSTVSSAWQNS